MEIQIHLTTQSKWEICFVIPRSFLVLYSMGKYITPSPPPLNYLASSQKRAIFVGPKRPFLVFFVGGNKFSRPNSPLSLHILQALHLRVQMGHLLRRQNLLANCPFDSTTLRLCHIQIVGFVLEGFFLLRDVTFFCNFEG